MRNFLRKLGIKLKDEGNVQQKEASELQYWKGRKEEEKELGNTHYKFFYTTHFSLADDFFNNKKILDIGCGPRGSLEWADMARERIGLDPLADEYLALGADQHKMQYVKGYSEKLPFADEYFDVVCSFNNIDHVENLHKSCDEIERVLKSGGLLLLLVDVHEKPTKTEPQTISWDFIKTHFSGFKVVSEEHYEKLEHGMYDSLMNKITYNHKDTGSRYGIISAKLQKV